MRVGLSVMSARRRGTSKIVLTVTYLFSRGTNLIMLIRELKGNIFDSGYDAIVNTVNCDGVMGKGLALEFKYRFPEMFKEYETLCKAGKIKPGILHFWKESTPKIVNFPTKDHWKDPSKMEYIEKGLLYFVDNYRKWALNSIAFPRLGSSFGGLEWEKVRERMYLHLSTLCNLDIMIYEFDSNAKDLLFERFLAATKGFSPKEYGDVIGIDTARSKLLARAIESRGINSMLQLQNLDGFGNKSVEKVYEFMSTKISAY